jgi:GNAT superfamily N-acetyltransferase
VGAIKPGPISAPEKLSSEHDLADFDSGEMVLDEWLRRRAAKNETEGASRTYVVCAGKTVAGYYSLAVGAIAHELAPGRVKRNMPDPVPVMILGRLAVDKAFQGKGIGTGLLKDAVLRTMQASEIAGIRALLVHAISDAAKRFYEAYGFIASPVDPMTVMITLTEAERVFLSGRHPR